MSPLNPNLGRERSLYSYSSRRDVQLIRRDLARLREQMSSGVRINRPSDAPADFAQARKLEALTDQYAQYQRSIEDAQPWVDRTMAVLDQLTEMSMRAYEQGVRTLNVTRSDEDREAIAQQLESTKTEAIDLLNERFNGEYLFAGDRTTKPPFNDDGTLNAPSYADISGERVRRIGPGETTAVNIGGDRVHQVSEEVTVIEAFEEMIAAMRSGDPDNLRGAIEKVNATRDHFIRLGAETGLTANRLSLASGQLRSASFQTEARRSTLEDANLLETVTDLRQNQNRLQAALKVTASVMQTSLLNFLR